MSAAESPASAEPSPPSRRYPEDFKRSAVRLVTDEQYTFKAASQAVGVSEKSLHDWHRKFGPPPVSCGDDASIADLQAENKRLRKELKQAAHGTRNIKKIHRPFRQ